MSIAGSVLVSGNDNWGASLIYGQQSPGIISTFYAKMSFEKTSRHS